MRNIQVLVNRKTLAVFAISMFLIAATVPLVVADPGVTYTETVDVYVVSTGGTIEWTHTYDGSADPIYSATLTIVADDVDGPDETIPTDGEQDEVYFNGNYLGLLNDMGYYTNYNYYPGAGNPDQGTTTTEFNIDPSWIGSSMTVEVVVEETWEVEIETSTLTIQQAHVETEKDFRYTNVNFTPYDAGPDGILGTEDDVQLSAELGDLLLQDEDGNYLVDVVVHKNGWVKSTNPGQLYGVITITPVQSVEMVSVSDVFGDFFDVNPAQLGGGVEVILIEDSTQLATILTYEDWVTCDVDNEAGEVDIDIDFTQSTDGSLDPGDTLMIYIKFQTAMKHEDWSGPDSFTNEAIITADDQEFTNSATILLSEKE